MRTPLHRITLIVSLLALCAAVPAAADDFLMYGPSLAVYIVDNGLFNCGVECRAAEIHGNQGDSIAGPKGNFNVDESHFATDAGHNVTIVSDAEWQAMTTQQFAAYDAIVIGDGGCELTVGDTLEVLNDTKTVWSPAVTGHLFLHTLDGVFHFNNNSPGGVRGTSPAQFQAMVDLAVDGMEFAASASGTGLYYADGCRANGGARGNALAFLSDLVSIEINGIGGADEVEIQDALHPSMVNLTNESLSFWGSSFHGIFPDYDPNLTVLAIGLEGGGGGRGIRPEPFGMGDVILATEFPLGGGETLAIPTASRFGLLLLGAVLSLAGWLTLRRSV